jgi:hypothetical protein
MTEPYTTVLCLGFTAIAMFHIGAWWQRAEQREQSASYAKCMEEGLYDCSKVYDWRVN